MMTLSINLPDREADQLRRLARALGTSPEELAADAVRERLQREQPDPDFEAAAKRVVVKNAKLYRRLA